MRLTTLPLCDRSVIFPWWGSYWVSLLRWTPTAVCAMCNCNIFPTLSFRTSYKPCSTAEVRCEHCVAKIIFSPSFLNVSTMFPVTLSSASLSYVRICCSRPRVSCAPSFLSYVLASSAPSCPQFEYVQLFGFHFLVSGVYFRSCPVSFILWALPWCSAWLRLEVKGGICFTERRWMSQRHWQLS